MFAAECARRGGGQLLLDHLHDGDVLAISPGTTVEAVAQALEATRAYQIVVVPILGDPGPD
ncbi:MAG: hypothetical protein IPK97_17940 [Ahniella sp.]|nr:hypothetical protein [Ahniella sp.]